MHSMVKMHRCRRRVLYFCMWWAPAGVASNEYPPFWTLLNGATIHAIAHASSPGRDAAAVWDQQCRGRLLLRGCPILSVPASPAPCDRGALLRKTVPYRNEDLLRGSLRRSGTDPLQAGVPGSRGEGARRRCEIRRGHRIPLRFPDGLAAGTTAAMRTGQDVRPGGLWPAEFGLRHGAGASPSQSALHDCSRRALSEDRRAPARCCETSAVHDHSVRPQGRPKAGARHRLLPDALLLRQAVLLRTVRPPASSSTGLLPEAGFTRQRAGSRLDCLAGRRYHKSFPRIKIGAAGGTRSHRRAQWTRNPLWLGVGAR
jgi:hypothetical protein